MCYCLGNICLKYYELKLEENIATSKIKTGKALKRRESMANVKWQGNISKVIPVDFN